MGRLPACNNERHQHFFKVIYLVLAGRLEPVDVWWVALTIAGGRVSLTYDEL